LTTGLKYVEVSRQIDCDFQHRLTITKTLPESECASRARTYVQTCANIANKRTSKQAMRVEITPVRPTRLDVLKFFLCSFSFSLSLSLSLFLFYCVHKAWYHAVRIYDPAPPLLTNRVSTSTGYLRSRAHFLRAKISTVAEVFQCRETHR